LTSTCVCEFKPTCACKFKFCVKIIQENPFHIRLFSY
jgi:hypothetical protein